MNRIQAKKKGKSKNNTPKWVVILIFILLIIQVALANSLVTKGKEINQLSVEREKLRAEIVSLENKVAQASSLSSIRQRARKLGMKMGKVEFLPPPSLASAP